MSKDQIAHVVVAYDLLRSSAARVSDSPRLGVGDIWMWSLTVGLRR